MNINIDYQKPIVFYDGNCPICSKEINHYKNIPESNALQWVDVHQDELTLTKYGLDKNTALQRFHVLNSRGQWKTGAYAFITIWSQLPRWRILASFIEAIRLTPFIDWCYGYFAKWRNKNNCTLGL
ncbi:MAG: DUF393 domain-containing protein [Gammaproteobacteria bacterium]|nr:DUF393 domain-containing protein [Gammaproteobacteria bacterium]